MVFHIFYNLFIHSWMHKNLENLILNSESDMLNYNEKSLIEIYALNGMIIAL